MTKKETTNNASRFSRRQFLKGAGAAGMALGAGGLLGACAPQAAAPEAASGGAESKEPVDLIHFVWVGGGQGVVPREVQAEYMRDNPEVTIELFEGTNATTYPQMVAQKEVDPNSPLVNFGFFNADATFKGDNDDMWVELDPEKIPHMDDIFDAYRRPDNRGIGWGSAGVGLLYNTDLVKEPPTSWNAILDPQYKGQVAVWDYAWSFNGMSAIAHINGADENNFDPAFEAYSQAAKDGQFHSLVSSNQQLKDAMVRGDVAIAPFFIQFGITWGAKGEGAPIAYAIPEEGMIAFPLYFQIVKGSTERQIEVASEIIDIYLSPETLSRYANLTASIPASKFVKLDRDLALEQAFQKEEIERAIQLDWAAIPVNN